MTRPVFQCSVFQQSVSSIDIYIYFFFSYMHSDFSVCSSLDTEIQKFEQRKWNSSHLGYFFFSLFHLNSNNKSHGFHYVNLGLCVFSAFLYSSSFAI